ncbi:MAG: hypothetical protein JST54_07780 [Deltaproteobacteria bacterium]|nr:hypothetical protein [Deltaproteobacteria bacterium]
MASDSSPFGSMLWLFGISVAIAVGVVAGIVYIPPTMANREIKGAVQQTLDSVPVTSSNDDVINRINEVLLSIKTSRYWVEDDGQHTGYDMALTKDMVEFTRDGNRQISADVSYTQEMLVPILKQRRVMAYQFHIDGKPH